jgi:hypothetical protein
MLRGQAVICLGLALAAAVWGQSGESSLRFEVASVRLSAKQGMITKVQGGPGTDDPGRFRMTNAELTEERAEAEAGGRGQGRGRFRAG